MPLQVAAVLPISRGMPIPRSRGMVQPGKGRRKRVCRHNSRLLDKKSRSPGMDSYRKIKLFQNIRAWIPKREIPDSGNRTMLQKPKRKSRCTRPLLDKKSKSPVRSRGRKKSLILSRRAVDLLGRTISASRRKWRKNSRIRKIITGGILTGSRRKKGNTIKSGYKRNTG